MIINIITLILLIGIFLEIRKLKNTPKCEGKINNLTEDDEIIIPPRTDKEQWRICQRRKGLPTDED